MYSGTTNNIIGLNQGKVLRQFNEAHEKYIDFNRIMETCTPDICSMKEGMNNACGKGSNVSVEKTMKNIQELDDEFSRTLSRYNNIQKQIKEEIVKKSQNYDTWKNHLGKVVVNNDNYYYVNNYGYTHKYSKSGLNANDSSCPSHTNALTIDNKMLDKLPTGDDMAPGQACQIAGKNIKNKKTKEYAFVDVRGVKHVYSKDSWKNKKKMCNSHALELDNKVYNLIPSGHNMTDKDLCVKVDVDPSLFVEMHKLNDQLLDIGRKLYDEINKLNIKDSKLKQEVEKKNEQVSKYIISLDQERIKLVDNVDYETIQAQEEDSELKMNSDYYHYLAFSFVALAVGGITLKVLMNSE